MSGDIGLEEPIIFYDEELTETKKVVLEHKGINLAYLSKYFSEVRVKAVDFILSIQNKSCYFSLTLR